MEVALYTTRHKIINADGEVITTGIFDNLPFSMDFYLMEQHAATFLTANKEKEVLHLYVTGFTPALSSFLIAYNRLMHYERPSKLILYHYDRDSGSYLSQPWFCRE